MPNYHINFKNSEWFEPANLQVSPTNTTLKVGDIGNQRAKQAKKWSYCRILCHAFLGNMPPKIFLPVFDFYFFPNFFQKAFAPPVNRMDAPGFSLNRTHFFSRRLLKKFTPHQQRKDMRENSVQANTFDTYLPVSTRYQLATLLT